MFFIPALIVSVLFTCTDTFLHVVNFYCKFLSLVSVFSCLAANSLQYTTLCILTKLIKKYMYL